MEQHSPIFLTVSASKIIPEPCLYNKKHPLPDVFLVNLLIETIQNIDEQQLQLAGIIKKMEAHLLEKYGEIYDPYDTK